MRILIACLAIALCTCVVMQGLELDHDLKAADDVCLAAQVPVAPQDKP